MATATEADLNWRALVQLRELIASDPVALTKWSVVIDHIVTQPADRLRLNRLIANSNFEEAILKTLELWQACGESRPDLLKVLREQQLNSLADKIDELGLGLLLHTVQIANASHGIKFMTIPLPRNFIGRAKELDVLRNMVHMNQVVYICGLGGIGKSTLALRFAKDESSLFNGNIIFITANSKQRIDESFRRLCELKELRGLVQDPNTTDQVRRSEVFRHFARHKCLFIYDNVETLGNPENGLNHFLPQCEDEYGSDTRILVTTRVRTGMGNSMQLDVLAEEDSMNFIKRNLSPDISSSTSDVLVSKLSQQLGRFPLALQQAVATINFTHGAHESPVEHYLQNFKRAELLKCTMFHAAPNMYAETIYTTWLVSFQQISNSDDDDDEGSGKMAIQLLEIMAYLDPTNIPTSVFGLLYKTMEPAEAKHAIDSSITKLRKYFMVTYAKPGFLNIHRLVQEVILNRLQKSGKEFDVLRSAMKLFVISLDEEDVVWPISDFGEFWSLRDDNHEKLPHGRALVSHFIKHDALLHKAPYFPTNLSYKLDMIGKNEDAMETLTACLEKYGSVLPGSRALVKLRERYANCLEYAERHEESANELATIYPISTERFGPEDGLTNLIGINYLISLVYTREYPKAKDHFLMLLRNPTIRSKLHVGDVTEEFVDVLLQNEVKLLRNVCQVQEAFLDFRTHPSILRTKVMTARAMERSGDVLGAIELLKSVLQSTAKNFGPDHRDCRNVKKMLSRMHSSTSLCYHDTSQSKVARLQP